jgi:hypothetical protein
MTAWPEFATVDPGQLETIMRGRVVIDPWAVLRGADLQQRGFFYARLGASPAVSSLVQC